MRTKLLLLLIFFVVFGFAKGIYKRQKQHANIIEHKLNRDIVMAIHSLQTFVYVSCRAA